MTRKHDIDDEFSPEPCADLLPIQIGADLQRDLATWIARNGPARADKLNAQQAVYLDAVAASRPEWFSRETDGVHLTPNGFAAVRCAEK